MKAIASIVILMSVSGSALAQESPAQSVPADRLGTWVPRDSNNCDTLYGDSRNLCLADRYRMHLEQQAHDEQAAVQRAHAENLRLHNELLRHELAQVQATAAAPSAAQLAATPGFANWQTENRWFGSDHRVCAAVREGPAAGATGARRAAVSECAVRARQGSLRPAEALTADSHR